MKSRKESVIVFSIAFVAGILSILHVLVGYVKTPPDSLYLWIPHYYLDFFVFVGGIAQGMRGNWFFENPYTVNDPSKTIMAWWQYVLYGKIFNGFHIPPTVLYTIIIFLLSFCTVWMMYLIIKRVLVEKHFLLQILTLLFVLFAGPFFNISDGKEIFSIVPYNFWQAPATFFDRFDPIPHHLSSTLLSLLIISLVAKTFDKIKGFSINQILFSATYQALFIIFLLTFSPFQVVNLISAIILTGLFFLRSLRLNIFLYTFFILLYVVASAILLKLHHQQVPMLVASSQSDVGYQFHPFLKAILLTTGPILFFVPFGLWSYFKPVSSLRFLLFSFVATSYVLFSSNLAYLLGSHNLRFLTTIAYVLFAVLSLLGILQLWKLIAGHGKAAIVIIIIAFFLLSLPPMALHFRVRLIDKNIFSETAYLNKEIIKGFIYIDKIPDNKVILTSPSIFLGAILPIFADKKVYLGRHAFTPDFESKKVFVTHLYNGSIKESEAIDFLKKNEIGYVLLAAVDGFSPEGLTNYQFLKPIYKNSSIIIFKVT
ncbi:hypothetical protein HYW87_02300 [Candidatus Roizmanbacteria bacterium]|nr:hypothetical protein [Candidatus Roizmanbacteria bacterium]